MATNDNMDTNAGAGCEDDRKLFAGGLPQDAKEAQIKEHFGQFGEIETVTLKTDMATGRSRGFCFIVYKSVDSLEAAVAAEHTISDKKVFVKKPFVFALRHSGARNHCFYGGLILVAAIAGTFLYKLLTLSPGEN